MKDPAFLFYSNDFLTGTLIMPFEERGRYITLLCYEHQNGRMTEETIRLLIGSFSDMLRLKFKQDEKGFWYNERLEKEIEKRNKFIESRINNGSKGGRPKSEIKPSAKPLGLPSENLIENENVIENEIIINKYNLICNSLPKVKGLNDTRKKKLAVRKKQLTTIQKWIELFTICENSKFLTGNNQNKWKASFDWLIENDTNLMKVLEGNYGGLTEIKEKEIEVNSKTTFRNQTPDELLKPEYKTWNQ